MPSACRVKIGKSGSGRRDLADVIDWSSRYLFYVPMSAILGIDQSIQDNSVAALSLWTGKDYRNLAEQVNKKTKPQVQSRPNETGSVS